MSALPQVVLDHLNINVRDSMEAAVDIYNRLGFHLTPRGLHNMGSINHLAVFGTDYLELIGFPIGSTKRRDLIEAPVGVNAWVFQTENPTHAYEALIAAGVKAEPPNDVSRLVDLPGGQQEAQFETVHFGRGSVFSGGRALFCRHKTRHLVWRDEWRHHPNGVLGICRAILVTTDPASLAELFRRIFGSSAVQSNQNGNVSLHSHTARFDVMTARSFEAEFPNAGPNPLGRDQYLAAISFRTLSLQMASKWLKQSGIADIRSNAERIVVPAHQAMQCTLSFVL